MGDDHDHLTELIRDVDGALLDHLQTLTPSQGLDANGEAVLTALAMREESIRTWGVDGRFDAEQLEAAECCQPDLREFLAAWRAGAVPTWVASS